MPVFFCSDWCFSICCSCVLWLFAIAGWICCWEVSCILLPLPLAAVLTQAALLYYTWHTSDICVQITCPTKWQVSLAHFVSANCPQQKCLQQLGSRNKCQTICLRKIWRTGVDTSPPRNKLTSSFNGSHKHLRWIRDYYIDYCQLVSNQNIYNGSYKRKKLKMNAPSFQLLHFL